MGSRIGSISHSPFPNQMSVFVNVNTVIFSLYFMAFTAAILSQLCISDFPNLFTALDSQPSLLVIIIMKNIFQKRCSFHYRGLECKSRKSRDTCSDRQIWLWSTQWSRAKANRVWPRECTGYSKHPLSTTQEKTLHMDVTRWSTPKSDWLYSLQPKMEKLYTVSKKKTRRWLWLRSSTPIQKIQT